ncbi:MAG TPA: WD40 repeat domain-containing protein, partial [Nocardioides sp.]|nr:WD40 repeat domain-containing protein [Nocardioides sp.]
EDTYLRQTTRVGDADTFAWAHLSPDGQQAVYRWLDDAGTGWVRFVDTATGERTPPTRLPAVEGQPWVSGAWHPRGGRYVGYVSYRCDGVHCGAPGTVTVLDSASGRSSQEPQDLVDGDDDIYSVAYIDEGRSLLVSDSERTFVVEGETLRPRGEPVDVLTTCCATAIGDGGTVMVHEWSSDGLSTHWRVLDIDAGEVLSEGDADLFVYTSAASPDGSTVALAGTTGEIVTVDIATGTERESTSLGAEVHWLSYSDDGELLVSGAADGGVSLWDASTLDLLGTVHPPRHGESVPSGAQFIGDTHDVAIASYDGSIYRWDTDVDRAIDFACQMAGRDMTEEEWAQFLPAQPYRSVCPQH